VPNPAEKAAAARVCQAEAAADAGWIERDTRLVKLRSTAPSQAVVITNQQVSKLNAPVAGVRAELEAAPAAPRPSRPGPGSASCPRT